MKEYRIEAKIKNNIILKRIEETGCKSVADFCKKNKLDQSQIGELINLKESPLTTGLRWKERVKKLADILGCLPEDLFSEEQKTMELSTNKKHIEMERKQLEYALENPGYLIENMSPEKICQKEDQKQFLENVLSSLTEKQRKVIEMRFFEELTLEECAKHFKVTKERIRQIEYKGMRRIRWYAKDNKIDFSYIMGAK